MAFANPGILYLLPLISLPTIIHLLGRRKYKKVYFSDIRFIKNLEKDVIKRLKIQQILILLLRTLIILLIILTFARPYLSKKYLGLNVKKGSCLYLVIDNSNSTSLLINNSNALEELLTYILTISDEFEYPFELNLILATAPDTISFVGRIKSPKEFSMAIKNITPVPLAGNLERAIEKILKNLKNSGELNKLVWILSDMQSSNIGSLSRLQKLIKELNKKNIYPVIVCGNFTKHNCSLRGYLSDTELTLRNAEFRIRVEIANWDTVRNKLSVALYTGEEKLAQNMVTPNPQGTAQHEFRITPMATNFLTGYISISNDNLPLDNKWFFSIPPRKKIKVLIAGRHPEDIKFIYNALISSDTTVVKPEPCEIKQLDYYKMSDFQVLIFSNIDTLKEHQVIRLKEALKSGSKIVLFPGVDCTPKRFNNLWPKGFHFPKWEKTLSSFKTYLVLKGYDRNHPIFKGMWRKEITSEFSSARFHTVPAFSITERTPPLITFSDGKPFLIEIRDHGKTIGMLFATSGSDSWSDLQYKGLFPALLLRAVTYLTGQNLTRTNIFVGDTIIIDPGNAAIPSEFTITKPNGNISYFHFDRSSGKLKFYNTDEPGLYTIRKGKKITSYIAVNIQPEETDGKFLLPEDLIEKTNLKDKLLWLDVTSGINTNNANLFSVISLELSHLFLIISLVLIAIEMYLSRINKIS